MKRLILLSIVFLFHSSFAYSSIYHYELQGLITYSDYENIYGYDSFIDVGNTAFKLFGILGDFGETAYCEIEEEIYPSQNIPPFFRPQSTPDFDVLDYRLVIDHPLGIWNIAGFDPSKELFSNDGLVNWELFGDLDWQILWIAVVHNDPDLPEYWEYDGIITSASLNLTPVPEPASVLFLSFGVAGLGLSRLKNSS